MGHKGPRLHFVDNVDPVRFEQVLASVDLRKTGLLTVARFNLDALQRAFEELNLPATYTTKVSGRGRELERTFKEFLWAFVLSVIFMYMILASQYESLVHPFTILLLLPLSLPFALFTMIVLNEPLNIFAIFGLFMLFGVVKKNGILQVDYTNTLANSLDNFNFQNVGYGQFSGVQAYRPLELLYFQF